MANEPLTTPDERWEDDIEWPKCVTCHGTGTVNPLTAPAGFLCLMTTTCPHCEGTGEDLL